MTVTKKCTLVVGLLGRRGIRSLLKRENFVKDSLDISYTEDKGILDSDFFIEVTGDAPIVGAWLAGLSKWIDDFND